MCQRFVALCGGNDRVSQRNFTPRTSITSSIRNRRYVVKVIRDVISRNLGISLLTAPTLAGFGVSINVLFVVSQGSFNSSKYGCIVS